MLYGLNKVSNRQHYRKCKSQGVIHGLAISVSAQPRRLLILSSCWYCFIRGFGLKSDISVYIDGCLDEEVSDLGETVSFDIL